ncbi:MAG TPA: hypothetical protein PK405_06715 [Hyphomicrobiales bacterium]|nr:hypothetical protein [Hyphomicrobiales bacterium]
MTARENGMTRAGHNARARRWRAAQPLAAVLALGLLSACGSSSTTLSSLRDTLTGKSRKASAHSLNEAPRDTPVPQLPLQTATSYDGEPPCPSAEIRSEATHYTIRAKGDIPDAKSIRFQGTLEKVSRECDFQPDYFAVKFGYAGRVLLGPSGGEGKLTLPVRVDFTTRGDRVVWSKVYKVAVAFAPGQTSVPFVEVSGDLVYQPKAGERLEDFRLYIGFDTPEER